MDLISKYKISHQSICLIEHFKNDELIANGTGFKVGGYLFTNNHVYNPLFSDYIILKFVDSDGCTVNIQKKYSKTDFQNLLIEGMPEDSWDFAIINLSDSDFNTIPSLMICEVDFKIEIGSQIYYLGFPLGQRYLSINGGRISAKYTNETNVNYLQLDASVNNGNSGGPLFDYKTDKIIGIVTRKNTGLTKKFNLLKKSFNDNIAKIEEANKNGGVFINGFNPLDGLKIIQSQLDLFSNEFVRSTNVGIGIAYEMTEIRKIFN